MLRALLTIIVGLVLAGEALTATEAPIASRLREITAKKAIWALRLAANSALANAYRSGQAAKVFKTWFAQIGLKPSGLMAIVYQLGALPE